MFVGVGKKSRIVKMRFVLMLISTRPHPPVVSSVERAFRHFDPQLSFFDKSDTAWMDGLDAGNVISPQRPAATAAARDRPRPRRDQSETKTVAIITRQACRLF